MTPELLRVLWACVESCRNSSSPMEQAPVWHGWVRKPYIERFGESFHQAKLTKLAELGHLKPGMSTRGGGRRYYTLANPAKAIELVKELDAVAV